MILDILLLACLALLLYIAVVESGRAFESISHSVAINRERPSEALSSVVIHKNASGRGDLSGIPFLGDGSTPTTDGNDLAPSPNVARNAVAGDNLQNQKQSVVQARLRSAMRGCLRVASAVANSAACPKFSSAEGTPRGETREVRELGSKEKLAGKAERPSQKPARECGIASPALVQQKVTANPKSDYAPQSPIMVGATNLPAPSPSTRFCQMPGAVAYSAPRPSRREQHETRRRILRAIISQMVIERTIQKL